MKHLIIILETTLVIVLTSFFISCNESKKDVSLSISKRSFDFSQIKSGQICTGEFIIYNNGKKELIIKNISPDCSCLNVKITNKRIIPGDSAIVNFNLKTDYKYGKDKNFIIIEANTDSILHYVTINSDVLEDEEE